MCIIAALLPNLKLDKETFDRCWDRNPDGFGIAYLFNGQLRIKKTMFKKDAWSIYHNVDRIAPESAKILHFRIGTHGTKDIDNCHPFMIDENTCFAHNGIIKGVPDCERKERNDTRVFNDIILKHLPKDFYKYEHYTMLIESFIDYSKLVFLNTSNELYIMNQKKGEWHEGVWFSNGGYKDYSFNKAVTFVPARGYGYSKGKSVAEMTDAEFTAYCKEKYGDDYLMKTGDWKNVKDSNVVPFKATEPDQYDYHQCEYCMTYKQNCKKYDNIEGYLCKDCSDELKEIIGEEFKTMSLDEIISALFSKEKAEEKIPKSEFKLDDWDEYYSQHYGSI